MLTTLADVVGSLLVLVGSGTYAYEVWRQRVIPNAVTWTLWFVIPLVTFSAELAGQVRLPAIFTLASSIGPLLVLVTAAFVSRAYWKVGPVSYLCAVLSVGSMLAWLWTRDGNYAILLSIGADLLAALPTIIKAYRRPESEGATNFLLGFIGTSLVLVTLKRWDVPHAAFPLYALIVNATLVLLVSRGQLRRPVRSADGAP